MSNEIKMSNFKTFLKPDPTYYFGNRIINDLGKLLKDNYVFDRVYFVTTDMLLDMYGKEILDMFKSCEIEHQVVTVEDGEENKRFKNLENLCDTLVGKRITKGSIVIGFGGGCVTNVIGLAAGLIFRGIRYIEMPTTLMGITDSTMSNKQAVNGRHGKNQYGMYYAPTFIFGDTRYMYTEPLMSKKAAIAEGIKNGFISNPTLLDYLEEKLEDKIENYSESDFNELAYKIIQSKIVILKKDPTEKASAMTLEYGHTFGHAMEFFSKGELIHGIAVSKGMCIAAELSRRLGYISQRDVDLHYYLLRNKLGIDVSIPEEISVDDIMKTILADNKKTDMGVKYVLLKQVGECLNPDGDYQVYVDPEIVREVLVDYKLKHASKPLKKCVIIK